MAAGDEILNGFFPGKLPDHFGTESLRDQFSEWNAVGA